MTRSRGRVSDFNSAEYLAGAPVHGRVVEDLKGPRALTQLAAEKDIRRRGQIVAKRQILVNDLDAVLARFHRPVQHELPVVHAHGAVAWTIIAGYHLDERGLPGAVIAHEPNHLSRFQLKATRR